MTPAPPPEDDLMAVLRIAEQLYQQDQTSAEHRQQNDAFRQAAAEMGLGDKYLRRAVAELQAQRDAAFQRGLARRRRMRHVWQGAAVLAVLLFVVWVGGALLSQLARDRRLSPHPLAPTSTASLAPPPAPVMLPSAPVSVSVSGMDLLKAVDAHDNVAVQRLLTLGVDPNSTTASFTPLIAAADHGYADTAGLLMDKGAHPNARDLSGETPLGYAARYGFRETVDLLLRRGADANAKNNRGWTAIHYACMQGNADLIPLLLDAGADINAKDDHGETPLMYAVADNRFAAVQLMLQRHADPNIRGFDGVSALGVARGIATKRPGDGGDLVQALQAAGAT